MMLKPKFPICDTKKKAPKRKPFFLQGEGGIRTLGPREESTVFETVSIDHSDTSPSDGIKCRKIFEKS